MSAVDAQRAGPIASPNSLAPASASASVPAPDQIAYLRARETERGEKEGKGEKGGFIPDGPERDAASRRRSNARDRERPVLERAREDREAAHLERGERGGLSVIPDVRAYGSRKARAAADSRSL